MRLLASMLFVLLATIVYAQPPQCPECHEPAQAPEVIPDFPGDTGKTRKFERRWSGGKWWRRIPGKAWEYWQDGKWWRDAIPGVNSPEWKWVWKTPTSNYAGHWMKEYLRGPNKGRFQCEQGFFWTYRERTTTTTTAYPQVRTTTYTSSPPVTYSAPMMSYAVPMVQPMYSAPMRMYSSRMMFRPARRGFFGRFRAGGGGC